MTMTTKQAIEVMQAYEDEKTIEARQRVIGGDLAMYGWITLDSAYVVFNFAHFDYRVKQEPREFYIVLAENGTPIGIAGSGKTAIIPAGSSLHNATTIQVREVL